MSLPPIHTVSLFREVCSRLLVLLQDLKPDEWHLATSSSQRNVKDIVSHLLDGSWRRLSLQRDGYSSPDAPRGFASDAELHAFLHRYNDEWTCATRRLSPQVLISLLGPADRAAADLFESLDPFGPAIFPVSWAGESQSAHWMDVARDYTEKWHHTQQIFEATGRDSTIAERWLFHPCLDTFMRALPFTMRSVPPQPAAVAVNVTGDAGGTWYVEYRDDRWEQVLAPSQPVVSTVTLPQLVAWKLVTKRRSRDAVISQFPEIRVEGDVEVGGHILETVSMIT